MTGLAAKISPLAGAIGGLLAVHYAGASQDYVYFHEALGSVGQMLDLAAPTAGAYGQCSTRGRFACWT